MKKIKLIILSMIILGFSAFADEKDDAKKFVDAYAEKVACNIEGVSFDRVFDMKKGLYSVLWYGDIDCYGGSGTHSFVLTVIKKQGNSFKVLEQDAFLGTDINSRFITHIEQGNKPRVLFINYKDFVYPSEEAPNNPSGEWGAELQFKNNKWIVVENDRIDVCNS